MKWIAIAGGVLLVGLLLLWREARSGNRPAAAEPARPKLAPAVERPARPVETEEPDEDAPTPRGVRPAGTLAPGDQEGPITKFSEEFWERVDETYSRRLLEFAAPCYEGGKHRKAKVKLAFRFSITDGSVAVQDARIVESTMGDAKLDRCMLREVSKAQFKDPRMPDWSSRPDEEETLVIRVEALKRFGPQTD